MFSYSCQDSRNSRLVPRVLSGLYTDVYTNRADHPSCGRLLAYRLRWLPASMRRGLPPTVCHCFHWGLPAFVDAVHGPVVSCTAVSPITCAA